MQHSPPEIKDRLLKALDPEYNVSTARRGPLGHAGRPKCGPRESRLTQRFSPSHGAAGRGPRGTGAGSAAAGAPAASAKGQWGIVRGRFTWGFGSRRCLCGERLCAGGHGPLTGACARAPFWPDAELSLLSSIGRGPAAAGPTDRHTLARRSHACRLERESRYEYSPR